jgi:hypothetical protein
MIPDRGLEYNRQWEAIANMGIGGPKPYVQPKVFTVIPASPTNPNLEVTIVGSGYTDMMAATHRPLMPVFDPTHIYYSFLFNLNIDPNAPTQGQALESEANYVYVDAKGISWEMPTDWQINIEENWMIQGFTPEVPWLDTGIRIPKLTPGIPCPIKISYLVDEVNGVCSTLGFVVNGVSYPMPAAFQKIPAQQKNTEPNVDTWAPGIYAQFQLDLASKGGSMTNKYSGVAIAWE